MVKGVSWNIGPEHEKFHGEMSALINSAANEIEKMSNEVPWADVSVARPAKISRATLTDNEFIANSAGCNAVWTASNVANVHARTY